MRTDHRGIRNALARFRNGLLRCLDITQSPLDSHNPAGAGLFVHDHIISRCVSGTSVANNVDPFQMLRIPASQTPLPSWDGGPPIGTDILALSPLAPILIGPAPQYVPPEIKAADPRIEKNVPYPITVGDLNSRIVTAGRIDPDIKTRRVKIPSLVINQANRITGPENNPYYANTLRTAYYLPNDFAQDTRRLMPTFFSPTSYPVSN